MLSDFRELRLCGPCDPCFFSLMYVALKRQNKQTFIEKQWHSWKYDFNLMIKLLFIIAVLFLTVGKMKIFSSLKI